jgi:hypothetical protein
VITAEGFVPLLQRSTSTPTQRMKYPKCAVIGRQTVIKFSKLGVEASSNSVKEDVIILLCVVRLVDVDTDLLISLNVPLSPVLPQHKTSSVPDQTLIKLPVTETFKEQSGACIGRASAALLQASSPPSSSVFNLSPQPSITEMLYTKVNTYIT